MLLTLRPEPTEEGFFSHSKAFCCHTLWDYRGRISHWASIRPQHHSKTPHGVRRSSVLCVTVGRGLSVWQRPLFPTLQQNWEEKPRADFWGCIHWWECVLACCWTGVDCSLHPLVGNQSIAVASTQELWAPKGQLISLLIAFTLTPYIGVNTYFKQLFIRKPE